MPKKATTSLVLKAPKTESSNRTIYLPQAVIDELRTAKAQQEQYKAMLGEEYRDYDLVIAQINGRPYERRIIDKMFYKLIAQEMDSGFFSRVGADQKPAEADSATMDQ